MKRISDREISKLTNEYYPGHSLDWNFIREIAQAQLESDQERVRELFEKIEDEFGSVLVEDELGYDIEIKESQEWLSLKQECLEGK